MFNMISEHPIVTSWTFIFRCFQQIQWSNVQFLPLPSGTRLQLAIEHGHRNSWFTHKTWWFSIAILVYQRVSCGLESLDLSSCCPLSGSLLACTSSGALAAWTGALEGTSRPMILDDWFWMMLDDFNNGIHSEWCWYFGCSHLQMPCQLFGFHRISLTTPCDTSPTGGLFGEHGFRYHLIHVTQRHHRLGDAAKTPPFDAISESYDLGDLTFE